VGEGLSFLAATAEDEGVAALEAHDVEAQSGLGDQQSIDLRLGARVLVGAFASVDQLGIRAALAQKRIVDQGVVEDDIGSLEAAQGFEGQQLRVAGASAHQ
jgi:hypothetical protein